MIIAMAAGAERRRSSAYFIGDKWKSSGLAGGGLTACGASERLIHDAADGTGAPPALGAAAKAPINVTRRSGRGLIARQGAAHVVVG